MTSRNPSRRANPLGQALENLTVVGMAVMVLSILATITGFSGVGLIGDPDGGTVMSVPVELDFDVDLGDRLPLGAPVAFGSPVEAQLEFLDPSGSERTVYVLWQCVAPLLVLAGLWIVREIARSARDGDPFTRENEKRLRMLALLVAVGGTGYITATSVIESALAIGSAASDQIVTTFDLNVLPLALGLVIAVLAAVWKMGIDLREETEGLI